MRLSFRVFSALVLAGGLVGCGGQDAGKPMKDAVMKPGSEQGKEMELKTKAGNKPMGDVPEGPEMPEALKKKK